MLWDLAFAAGWRPLAVSLPHPMNDSLPEPAACPQCGTAPSGNEVAPGRAWQCRRCGEIFTPHPLSAATGTPPPAPSRQWPPALVFATGAVLCLLTAAALWYMGIQRPLEEMRAGEQHVRYSMQRVVFIPLFALSGAALLGGAIVTALMPQGPGRPLAQRRVRVAAVVLLVVSMLPGWLLYDWFSGQMQQAGYVRGLRGAEPAPVLRRVSDIPPPPRVPSAGEQHFQERIRRITESAGVPR